MEAKTDWKPESIYNIYTEMPRTERNIHEIGQLLEEAGQAVRLDEKLSWVKLDFLTARQLNRGRGNLAATQAAMGIRLMPEEFGDMEPLQDTRINHLEACIQRTYWTAAHTPPVEEAGGGLVADRWGEVVLCRHGEYAAAYPSAYAGRQMDAFIEQIKGWNHGEL